jgi:outer membrane immunogenic protein
MRKVLVATAALLALSSAGTADAADLGIPFYKAPPPAPVYSFTGCYVGVGGGYKLWNIDHDWLDPTGTVLTNQQGTAGGRGWLATAQVGCDYQFYSSWVVGAFADWDWTNARGDYNNRSTPLGVTVIDSMRERWSWTAGGRIGYLVAPQLMTFFSAGYAQANFDSLNLAFSNAPAIGLSSGLTIGQRTFNGYFLGGGVEYAVGWFPGLYWKSEARFATYSARTDPVICTSVALCGVAGGTLAQDRTHLYQQSYRSELVWPFNWDSPVRAAY